MKRIVVGLTGASGVIYGVRTLETLGELGIETHLIISEGAAYNLAIETKYSVSDVESMASVAYPTGDIGAAIASGSFRTDGMIVVPCSIKTLSAVANSFDFNLLVRAADVTLKERRRLVLAVRETPLHEGHLELMLRVTRMGGIIMPPVPSFYHMPRTIDDIVDQTVGKILDLFSIDAGLFKRWNPAEKRKDRPVSEGI
jgi:flavin prenyltransferase